MVPSQNDDAKIRLFHISRRKDRHGTEVILDTDVAATLKGFGLPLTLEYRPLHSRAIAPFR